MSATSGSGVASPLRSHFQKYNTLGARMVRIGNDEAAQRIRISRVRVGPFHPADDLAEFDFSRGRPYT